MPQIYLDFNLTLTEDNGHYWVWATAGTISSQKKQEFTLPFSWEELEKFIVYASRSLDVGEFSSENVVNEKELGSYLYEKLFTDEILRLFTSLQATAEGQEMGVRISINFFDAPMLIRIPWELLVDKIKDIPFVLTEKTPIVRKLNMGSPPKLKQTKGVLRVLVMISNPCNTQKLDVEKEWGKIKEATQTLQDDGRIVLHRVKPSLPELMQELHKQNDGKSYHVFHYIGHGQFEEKDNNGFIFLETEKEQLAPISGDVLGRLLYDGNIQLVVLNTCQGGRTSLTDPFVGVGQSLLKKQVPAVIAMQFKITDLAAICFSEAFYAALVQGNVLEVAVGKARQAIYARQLSFEWATPVLYTSTDSISLVQNVEREDFKKKADKKNSHHWMIVSLLVLPVGLLLVFVMWWFIFPPLPESPYNFHISGRTTYQGGAESDVSIQLLDYPEIKGMSKSPTGFFSLEGKVGESVSSVRYIAKKEFSGSEYLYSQNKFSLEGDQGDIKLNLHKPRY